MKHTLRKNAAAALLVLAPLGAAFVAQPAAAQYAPQYRVAQVDPGRITNLSLDSDAGLAPGATLRVRVLATPDARFMNATLGNSGVRVALREREPGEYVGTHVIRRDERIDPRQAMTVRAGWGEGPVAVVFDYPPSFQALAMGAGTAVVVDAFTMSPADDLEPGQVVRFRVEGTPRARVSVNVPDVVRNLPLQEVRPGVYAGRYTIRRRDDPDAFRDAEVILRSGDQRIAAHVNTERRYGYSGR
ncbi:MAG TPA: hypothetical protein VFM98_02730 [Ramlibacter sp.]|uniref:hypothetical protein n=1 Tax=Ramlibacter sp. TaxID=1917967 RepID=UPI002D7F4298|nr:hypothetical protein [Ramlibacter sp.]HET8744492.1 hypothetical protein [Ramlibacter sp.]